MKEARALMCVIVCFFTMMQKRRRCKNWWSCRLAPSFYISSLSHPQLPPRWTQPELQLLLSFQSLTPSRPSVVVSLMSFQPGSLGFQSAWSRSCSPHCRRPPGGTRTLWRKTLIPTGVDSELYSVESTPTLPKLVQNVKTMLAAKLRLFT